MAQVQGNAPDLKKSPEDLMRDVEKRLGKKEMDRLVRENLKIDLNLSDLSAETRLRTQLPGLQSASKRTVELDSTLKKLPTLNETERIQTSKDLDGIALDLQFATGIASGKKTQPTGALIEKALGSLSAVQTAFDKYQPFSVWTPNTWGNVLSEPKARAAVLDSWKQFKKDFAPIDELVKSLSPAFR